MKILTVKGMTKSGKSSAIRYAILCLLSDEKMSVEYNSKKYPNDTGTLFGKIDEHFVTDKNFVGQITCAGRIGKRKVCITTYGDSFVYDIYPALKKGKEIMGELDLFVCASHGKGFEAVEKLVEKQDLIVVNKERSANEISQIDDNKKFGETIVDRLIKAL